MVGPPEASSMRNLALVAPAAEGAVQVTAPPVVYVLMGTPQKRFADGTTVTTTVAAWQAVEVSGGGVTVVTAMSV